MDYEKLHKETINKLQQMVSCGKITVETACSICADFVPESEDERIREDLIQWINEFPDTIWRGHYKKDILAWLEKQGKNNMGISEATKKKLEDNLDKALEKETPESWNEFLDEQGEQNQKHFELKAGHWYICHRAYCCRADHLTVKEGERFMCEKDGIVKGFVIKEPEKYFKEVCAPAPIEDKQKSTNKVEPKFKKGDWITNGINTNKIIGIDLKNEDYLFENGISDISIVDSISHLWTIQDAKDGDVLVGGEQLFLFKKMNTSNSFYAHCNYHFIGYDSLSVYDCSYSIDNIYPATKEQCDLLFQKMKEAGYEWNAEKKKLKKIKQKPTVWNDDNEQMLDEMYEFFDKHKFPSLKHNINDYAKFIKSLKERVIQQQEWSEEDESMRTRCIGILGKCYMGELPTKVEEELNWLKSLKDKYTWKPSEAQIKVLEVMLTVSPQSPAITSALLELYEQLKKLREE